MVAKWLLNIYHTFDDLFNCSLPIDCYLFLFGEENKQISNAFQVF